MIRGGLIHHIPNRNLYQSRNKASIPPQASELVKYLCLDDRNKKIVKKMFEELKESNKDGKEHGFSICSNDKNISGIKDENTISTETCIGEWCSVSFKRCPRNMNITNRNAPTNSVHNLHLR